MSHLFQFNMGRKRRRPKNPPLLSGATGPALLSALPVFNAAFTTAISFTEEPAEPVTITDRGLAITPIVGVREFQIYMELEHPTLFSFNGACWPARKALAAGCGNNMFADHEVPDLSCHCGIYAWQPQVAHRYCSTPVRGEVYMWGDVLIHDLGYRAEFAYPKSLTLHAHPTRSVMRIRDSIADAYGIPVSIIEPEVPEPTEEEETTAFYPHWKKV